MNEIKTGYSAVNPKSDMQILLERIEILEQSPFDQAGLNGLVNQIRIRDGEIKVLLERIEKLEAAINTPIEQQLKLLYANPDILKNAKELQKQMFAEEFKKREEFELSLLERIAELEQITYIHAETFTNMIQRVSVLELGMQVVKADTAYLENTMLNIIIKRIEKLDNKLREMIGCVDNTYDEETDMLLRRIIELENIVAQPMEPEFAEVDVEKVIASINCQKCNVSIGIARMNTNPIHWFDAVCIAHKEEQKKEGLTFGEAMEYMANNPNRWTECLGVKFIMGQDELIRPQIFKQYILSNEWRIVE